MQVQTSPLEPNSLIYKIKLRMDGESESVMWLQQCIAKWRDLRQVTESVMQEEEQQKYIANCYK